MKTTYLKNKLLEHITGKTTYTKPAATYIGFLTDDPTVDGVITGREVSGGSYARQSVTWGVASNGLIRNTNVITFPAMPSSTVKYWAIFDAATNGNMLEYFAFDEQIVMPSGLTPTIIANNLILRDA